MNIFGSDCARWLSGDPRRSRPASGSRPTTSLHTHGARSSTAPRRISSGIGQLAQDGRSSPAHPRIRWCQLGFYKFRRGALVMHGEIIRDQVTHLNLLPFFCLLWERTTAESESSKEEFGSGPVLLSTCIRSGTSIDSSFTRILSMLPCPS